MLRKKLLLALTILLCVIGLFGLHPLHIQAASVVCPDLSSLQGSYSPGVGRAVRGPLSAGARLTFTATLGTATISGFQTGVDVTPFAYSQYSSVPGQHTHDITTGGNLWISVANPLASNGTIFISVSCVATPVDSIPPHLLDGRINKDKTHDLAAPIVVYGHNTYDIYAVDLKTSAGNFVLRLTADTIKKKGIPSQKAILLAETTNPFSNQPIKVYRLVSGEVQINTYYADGKPYTIAWPADNPDNLVHLAP